MYEWNSVFEEFKNVQKRRTQLSAIFDMLLKVSLDRKVSFMHKLLCQDGFLPKIDISSGKSEILAKNFRFLGNELFYRKKDLDALKYYTKSVAYSPLNSEELALAYGNRSAVLLNLRKHSSSLIDINRSLKLSCPDNFKQKLLRRKTLCLENIKKNNEQALEILNTISELSLTDDWIDKTVQNNFKCCQMPDENATDLNYENTFMLPNSELDNKLFKDATSRLRMNYNEKFGRHLIATKQIPPGEAVIIDKPFATILLPDYNYSHCANCFLRCEILIPCSQCHNIMFCSEKCRAEAWALFHRVECEFLECIFSMDLDRSTLLALRTLIIASKQGETLKELMAHPIYGQPFKRRPFNRDNVYNHLEYSSVHDMIDNFDKKHPHFQFYRCSTSAVLIYVLKMFHFFDQKESTSISFKKTDNELSDIEAYAGTLLLKYMYTAESNSHEICEVIERSVGTPKREMTLGAGLYPSISMANHSCNPNLVRFSHKNYMVFYTLAPVLPGVQLTDNYGFHFSNSTLEKRRNAFQNYLFQCECEACIFDWPLYESLPVIAKPEFLTNDVYMKQWKQLSQEFNEWLKDPITSSIVDEYQFLCNYNAFLHNIVKHPWKEYLECQEALRQMISMRANYYTYYNDLII